MVDRKTKAGTRAGTIGVVVVEQSSSLSSMLIFRLKFMCQKAYTAGVPLSGFILFATAARGLNLLLALLDVSGQLLAPTGHRCQVLFTPE